MGVDETSWRNSRCLHQVPSGIVEAINANIRGTIRRGRGYRDYEYLILKVRKATATARSIRAAQMLISFHILVQSPFWMARYDPMLTWVRSSIMSTSSCGPEAN